MAAEQCEGVLGCISIHALREEGDVGWMPLPPEEAKFLSTPSARRATRALRAAARCRSISIHALREEGDKLLRAKRLHGLNFYPRPPRGGRPLAELQNIMLRAISIHALREEGDYSIPGLVDHH